MSHSHVSLQLQWFFTFCWQAFTNQYAILYKSGKKPSRRASSPIWASKASLARTHERAAKSLGPSLVRSRETRPNRRAFTQARKSQNCRMYDQKHAQSITFLIIRGILSCGMTSYKTHVDEIERFE